MNMIGHNHGCVKINSGLVIPKTMLQHQIAGFSRQWLVGERTESNKQVRVRLLQMWKPPPVAVLGKRS
jgi:hypothetical protein